MDLLKQKIVKWQDALKWALQDETSNEEDLKLAIDKCLTKSSSKEPRIASCSNAMADVESHFRKSEKIDVPILSLYQSLLKIHKRTEVLAFLQSCCQGNVDEEFYEMPTPLISHMVGRPCRTRDIEVFSNLPLPSRPFSHKTPTLLIADALNTRLIVRGNEVASIRSNGGFLAPIPTSSTLEQLVVQCDVKGVCKLLSTTRKNIELVGEFQLDVPENETIDWMDALVHKGHAILYWGGTDPLRGQVTWNYFSGICVDAIADDDKELFYDVDGAALVPDHMQALKQLDFTVHGNLMTLWTQHEDTENNGIREWSTHQLAVMGSFKSPASFEGAKAIWGAPQQFLTLHEHSAKVWVCGELRNSFDVSSNCKHACVLYAHAR